MDEKQFFRKVAEQATLSVEEAADITRATLTTMALRMSATECRRLASQLPAGLAGCCQPQDRVEKFGLEELMRRVARHTGLTAHETRTGLRAVLTTLSEAVDAETFDHVMTQLPGDIRAMAPIPATA